MTAPIGIRLANAAQPFSTLDPTPFRKGGLASEAEECIVGWAAPCKPAGILLYDRLPIMRTRALYRCLAAAPVRVVAG